MNYESIRTFEGLTNKQVTKSVLLHVALVLFFTVNAYIFPAEDLNFDNAIRVDIVGLPEKLKHLPPPSLPNKEVAKPVNIPPPTPPKEVPAPTPTVPVAPVMPTVDKNALELERKKAQQKAVDRLKALDAVSQIEESEMQEREKEATAVAGNVESAGNALSGIRQNQISSYISQVKDHVNKNWNIPQWMADAHLKAEAIVLLDANGVVIQRRIVKTSGNSSFDDSILTAIDQSSPFPAPPKALVGVFKNKGFTLGFPE